MKVKTQNLFAGTRIKLDIIAAVFIFFMLLSFSFAVYHLLTIDIIYQTTGEFSTKVDENILFENFKQQTIFLLALSDSIVFIVSMILFDRLVKNLLSPIEYLSNVQKKFAENLSHELRTPLSIMNMHGEILLNKIANKNLKEEDIVKNLNDIQREIKGITPLIDDLLFEARINYEESKSEKIDLISLQNIIKEILEKLSQYKSKEVKIKIENKITKENLDKYFEANTLHVERILNNIFSNALKFTNHGEVEIILENYTKNKKNYLKIVIEDTGLGIKKDDLKKVGERFFRGGNVENEIAGTGIGLAIVSDLAKKYDWNFNITSEENLGTRVEISKIVLI
jgi:signal transduction histidine kinase